MFFRRVINRASGTFYSLSPLWVYIPCRNNSNINTGLPPDTDGMPGLDISASIFAGRTNKIYSHNAPAIAASELLSYGDFLLALSSFVLIAATNALSFDIVIVADVSYIVSGIDVVYS